MSDQHNRESWLDAAEASRALGVTPATLYAYVSRGYIRSEPRPGASRERRYSREDVERLRRRTEGRRDPDRVAAHALQWGLPILESSITLIAGNALYYRGHDVATLARTRSVAQVASLIWTGRFETDLSGATVSSTVSRAPSAFAARSAGPRTVDSLPFVARAQSVLAGVAARDPLAFDLRALPVAFTGWRILTLLAAVAARSRRRAPSVDEQLARAWNVDDRGVDVLRAALILCADHELNVSSFTARSVASSGASPYAVVIAGLAAVEGIRHGGISIRVEALLASLGRSTRSLQAALGERMRRGESIDGFGHPLYPDGDPRAVALMDLLRERFPRSPERAYAVDVAEAAGVITRERPTIDFALTALTRVLRLPAGSPLTLFALGRTIGWIGHAIEQYATGQIIRPRARYVGDPPVSLTRG